jgi:uroporphyrinogen-III synthase
MDADKLADAMMQVDIIAITSPQSAAVFIDSWKSANNPVVRVITVGNEYQAKILYHHNDIVIEMAYMVGKGTSKPLEKEGIYSAFTPSDFNAETLAKELPLSLGKTILYPTSAIAENTLQNGLEARGFTVTRLNTYSTVASSWTEVQLAAAKSVDIVTFASPSAVKTWAERVGTNFIAVVIGPTSARAAEKLGFVKVLCPEGSKGVEAWADLIKTAAKEFAGSSSSSA